MIASGFVPLVADAFARVDQDYLLEARQMQALSFAVHIPLVCFGIAFPTLVLVVEWLHLRTGDPLYRQLAKRWSKAMLALFAVGVVTGTILSFEMGLLWPGFMSAFGDVFGLGFALEGISFFVEAIFIAIYVYGWDRLSPRLHFLSGIPVALAGITGSFMVLSVNAWMQNPSGFRLKGGHTVDVEPAAALFGNSYLWPEFIHMYLAAYMVVGFLIAGAYAWAWLRGRRSRYVTRALTVALTAAALAAPAQIVVGDWIARQVAEDQPTKLAAFEGLGETQRGAAIHIGGWYNEETGEVEHGLALPRLLSLLAHHDPNAEVQGLDAGAGRRAPPGQCGANHFPGDGRYRLLPGTRWRDPPLPRGAPTRAPVHAVVLPRGDRRRAAGGCRPDRRLGYDRGRTPAVGRLRRDAHGGGGDRSRRHRRRVRHARRRLRRPDRGHGLDSCAACRGRRSSRRPAMELAEAPLVLSLVGLAAYMVLGGADFGAGLWFLLSGRGDDREHLREHTFRAMGPVWEANHVWLIFVLVVCWTAYPVAFGSIASTLAVPLFIAAVGIIMRGTAYALRSGSPSRRQDSGIGLVFSLSSVLTPFALGTAIGGIASGRVPVGNAEGDLLSSWLNPTSLLIGVLAVATAAYLAAVFLAADAARQHDEPLTTAFRRRALVAGVVAGAIALGGLAVVREDASGLFEGLTEGAGLGALFASVAAGIWTMALVSRSRFEPARYTAAVAVAAIVVGWGAAQSPTFLPGLTVEQAAAETPRSSRFS